MSVLRFVDSNLFDIGILCLVMVVRGFNFFSLRIDFLVVF